MMNSLTYYHTLQIQGHPIILMIKINISERASQVIYCSLSLCTFLFFTLTVIIYVLVIIHKPNFAFQVDLEGNH